MALPLSRITRSLSRRLTLSHLSASLRYRSNRLRELYRNSIVSLWNTGLKLSNGDRNHAESAGFFQKRVYSSNRTYLGKTNIKGQDLDELEGLLVDIASGRGVSQEELLPYLCLEEKHQRAHVNAMLADAFVQRQTPEALSLAKTFIKRAWITSGAAPELLDLYIKIHRALNDVEGIRDAYKRLGMNAARSGDIAGAIHFFDEWHWAYNLYAKRDEYQFDFDILDCMDTLAAPYRVPLPGKPYPPAGEKIRIAYLLRGFLDTNSNLLEISLEFAKHHDRSRFDIVFFAVESKSLILSTPHGADYLKNFADTGYEIVLPSSESTVVDVLLKQAERIRATDAHLLVTSAALADFSHYFITSLRPAPIGMGLVQGPPAQFAPPMLDWCIAWTRHPLLDTPANCSWVEIKMDYKCVDVSEPLTRAKLDLPVDACVLLSAGRYTKFQSLDFWQAIIDLLSKHEEAYYVVCGARELDIPFLDEFVPEQIRSRIRCLGWREDFLKIVSASDILLDTYPNGGGQTIVQAMASGVPVVAHRNDFLRLFDQNDWSPVEDFIRDPEILVTRGDFDRFKQIASRLIEDEAYRKEVGERCRAEHERVADPSQAIRGCEEVYEKVVKLFSKRGE